MASKKQISALRKEYTLSILTKESINKNPFKQFKNWFEEAVKADIKEPNAMTLATADKNGLPSARIVLLKDFDETGFTFFTNYKSRKGKELIQNPHAYLVFFWKELERQVRIEGLVEKINREESEEYFKQRPFESQIGSMASIQSELIPNRKYLEETFDRLKKEHADKKPFMPLDWGGFLVIPFRFEFWQGRENRLHDRILFEKNGNDWKIGRLSP